MKRILQGVAGNLWPEDVEGWQRWCDKFIIHQSMQDLSKADPDIPLVGGLNLAQKEFRTWMAQGRPYICFNRPHIGGWADAYPRRGRRVSINSYACTEFGRPTHNRWAHWNLLRQPWKVQQVQNVLIAPPSKSIWYWTGKTADQWAQEQKTWFEQQGATVRMRMKNSVGKGKGGRYASLWNDLDWADLVVSYSSAITVEAFWWGKKVISLGVCPTWTCCSKDYTDWQNPTEPLGRSDWHEHVAWTQFDEQEWRIGAAQDMLMAYQGHLLQSRPTDNFKVACVK